MRRGLGPLLPTLLLALLLLVLSSLPGFASPTGEFVDEDLAREAALRLAQERWPGSRILSMTPYLALDDSVNAWCALVAQAGCTFQSEDELFDALAAVGQSTVSTSSLDATSDSLPGTWSGQRFVGVTPTATPPALSSTPVSARLAPEDLALARRGMADPDSANDLTLSADAADPAAALVAQVGCVLVAARTDLYPLLERFAGLPPHLQAALAGAPGEPVPTVYYTGPFSHLVVTHPADSQSSAMSVQAATTRDASDGRLPGAPEGKNDTPPAEAWDQLVSGATAGAASKIQDAEPGLPGVLVDGVPYLHQDDYGHEACAPTASAQVLAYWDTKGYGVLVDGGAEQYSGNVAELVYDLMRAQEYTIAGTQVDKVAPGINAVANDAAYGNGLHFAARVLENLTWPAITAEIAAGRPCVYLNQVPESYPYWSHATTVVGYDDSDGHILYVHWNFPPDEPYELNWDNIPPDNETLVAVRPDTTPFTTLLSDGFETGMDLGWLPVITGQSPDGWAPTAYRARNQTPDPSPPGGNPSRSAYCVGSLTSAPGPYPGGNDAWLVYGPFSTAGMGQGSLDVAGWLDIPEAVPAGDALSLLASLDGEQFHGTAFSGRIKDWQDLNLDLGDVPGLGSVLDAEQAWVAVRFVGSGASSVKTQGAFIDNVRLTLTPANGWWWSADAPGTGLSLEVQGQTLFMAWYVYDEAGLPLWFVSLCQRGEDGLYRGTLMESFSCADPSCRSFSQQALGDVTLDLGDARRLHMEYALYDGLTGSMNLTPLMADLSPGERDPRDIQGWWNDPDQEGVGLFCEVQGETLYVCWYSYDGDGQPRWWSLGGEVGGFPAGSRSLKGVLTRWSDGQVIGGASRTPLAQPGPEAVLTFLEDGRAMLLVDGEESRMLQRFAFGQ